MFKDTFPHRTEALTRRLDAVFIKRKSKRIELTPAEVAFRRDVESILERVIPLRKNISRHYFARGEEKDLAEKVSTRLSV